MKKKEETRQTVGKLATDLIKKADDYAITPNEATKGLLSEYEKNIDECVEIHKKKFGSDFFLVVLVKKEKTLKNVLRNYFFGRLSCPTPNYDQIVYKYDIKKDSLELIWVIPDRPACHYMIKNKLIVDKSQWELLSYVLKFKDGSLFTLAKNLNGEKEDTPELKEK